MNLTVNEAAARLGCRPVTVRLWCKSGKIPGVTRHGWAWAIPEEALAGLTVHTRRRKRQADPDAAAERGEEPHE